MTQFKTALSQVIAYANDHDITDAFRCSTGLSGFALRFAHVEELSQKNYVIFRTPERFVAIEHFEAIAGIIQAAGAHVHYNPSWNWVPITSPGKRRNRYQHVYELCVTPNSSFTWEMPIICTKRDPRADRCIFELLEEAGIAVLDASYDWTPGGFALTIYANGETASKVCELFGDATVVRSSKRGRHEINVEFRE